MVLGTVYDDDETTILPFTQKVVNFNTMESIPTTEMLGRKAA